MGLREQHSSCKGLYNHTIAARSAPSRRRARSRLTFCIDSKKPFPDVRNVAGRNALGDQLSFVVEQDVIREPAEILQFVLQV